MFWLIKLTKAEQVANLLQVWTIYESLTEEVSLLLLCFLSQNVTVVSMISFYFSCSGKRESLFCTGVSLNFWHFFVCLNCYLLYVATHIPGRYAQLSCCLCRDYSSPLRALRASALTLALASRPPFTGISSATFSASFAERASASRFSRSIFCWLFFTTPAFFGAR